MEIVNVKDSIAAEYARLRNNAAQKRLYDQLKQLGDKHEHDRSKTFSKILEARKVLREVNPSPHRQVVCPFGLTLEQKEQYRTLRRRSLPTMSLGEFDKRLEDIRQQNSTRRKSDITPYRRRRPSDGNAYLAGRRVSDPASVNFSQTTITSYTEVGSPLLAQKHKFRDVLKRATNEKIFGENSAKLLQRPNSVPDTPSRN